MSLQRMALYGSTALVVVGVLLRAFGIAFGLDVILVALFVAVISTSFAQRSTQHALSTTRRSMTERLRALGQAQDEHRRAIDELTALQRTTLYYAKHRPGMPASMEGQAAGQRSAAPGRAGRSSTPDVSNAAADMTFASLLEPARSTAIGGVLSEHSRRALPEGTTVRPFLPGRAVESLDSSGALDLIVVDEAALADAPWSRSTGPAGIPMMQDLLDMIRVARDRGIATVIVPSRGVPDIHSSALHSATSLRLPLTDQATHHAAGAPLSPALRALHELAVRRGAA